MQVEDGRRIEPSRQYVGQQLGDVDAHGRDTAPQRDVATKQRLEVERLDVREADIPDRAAGTGDADRGVERLLRSHALEHRPGAELGQRSHALDRIAAALGDHVGGAERTRDAKALLVMPEHDDALGAKPAGGEHGAESHSAIADDDGGGPRDDMGEHGRMMAGAHHVSERRERRRQAMIRQVHLARQRDQRRVSERDAHRFSLATVVRATPEAAVHARRRQPLAAEFARAIREGKGSDDAVSLPDRAHVAAYRVDDAHELVPDARPGEPASALAIRPEIGAADTGVGDPHQRIAGVAERRVRHFLHPDVAGAVIDRRLHR